MTGYHPSPGRGGYTLIELTLVLTLLAIFAGIANELFMLSFHVKDDALKAGQQIAQTDAVVRLLRSDVWGAISIRSETPESVELTMPDGAVIRWTLHRETIDEENAAWLIRTMTEEGAETTSEPHFAPQGVTFKSKGADLYLVSGNESLRLPTAASLFGDLAP